MTENTDRRLVVLWAGNRWDGLPATDHHLARALSAHCDVLWVDPSQSRLGGRPLDAPVLRSVADHLRVLDLPAPPAHTRRGVRKVTELAQQAAVRAVVAREKRPVWVSLVCSPRAVFPPRKLSGVRILHVTDDWLAGAPMLGLDRDWLCEVLLSNLRRADVVSAVSPGLAEVLAGLSHRHDIEVVPNGATMSDDVTLPDEQLRHREAVLVGQLNERLDFAALQAVVDAGVPIRVIGPRTAREPQALVALERLFASPLVEWLGAVEHQRVGGLLSRARVGLTPYRDDEFNRASFPLKTLEYLALGLPVVSSRLDSLDWLGTDLVDVADSPQQFAALVKARVDGVHDPGMDDRRREFAAQHSWDARAARLVELAERIR